jgi:hypothetical protein
MLLSPLTPAMTAWIHIGGTRRPRLVSSQISPCRR